MFELPETLGALAAAHRLKEAVARQRGRSGRTVKAHGAAKQLRAAGSPRMNTPGVMPYPSGFRV